MTNLLNTKQAAEYLGLENHATLYVWRCNGTIKIPCIKIGKNIRYRKADLDAFLESKLENFGGCDE